MKALSSKSCWICTGLVLLLAGASLADKYAKPPAPKELVGVYVGYSDYYGFYRLDLREDFTGYFAEVALPKSITHEQGVRTYRITKWGLKGFELSFDVGPPELKGYEIYLKGGVGAFDVLRLETGGTARTNRWSRKLTLYPEEQVRVVTEETKEAIKRAEAK